jgi:hypothetical protein
VKTNPNTILLAEQYVTQTYRFVARQRDRVERLHGAGYDTSDAEQTLRVFEKSSRAFEDYAIGSEKTARTLARPPRCSSRSSRHRLAAEVDDNFKKF